MTLSFNNLGTELQCLTQTTITMNKRHLLTMSLALACASVFAETVDFGGLKFSLTPDGKAVLTSGKAALGTVVIPQYVRGHKVTEIKANAFQGNTDIRSITINLNHLSADVTRHI